MFYSGHSSTAASSALGLSTANTMRGSKNTVVAVVGDGSMTGGMFYEALNNAGRTHDRLIIVLNDNEMSISEMSVRWRVILPSSERNLNITA